MPQLGELRSIFHYHQYVGTADTMLGLTQSPYQKSFELFFKGVIDGFHPKVGAVRDQGGEQRPGQIGVARLIPAERLEGAGEAAPFVDVLQQILGSE